MELTPAVYETLNITGALLNIYDFNDIKINYAVLKCVAKIKPEIFLNNKYLIFPYAQCLKHYQFHLRDKMGKENTLTKP